jgi:hypothetical protein
MSLHQIQRNDDEANSWKIFTQRVISGNITDLEAELPILKRIAWE